MSDICIDKRMLTVALLEYVRNRLAAQGVSPTQKQVADEIGVGQSMISQVEDREKPKSFSLSTLQDYAKKIGKSPGELAMELMALVPAGQTTDTHITRAMRKDSIDEVFNEVEIIRRMLLQEKAEGKCVAEAFYTRIVERAFVVLRRCGIPLTATAMCFNHGTRARWLVRNGRSEPGVRVLRQSVPTNLAAAVQRCWRNSGESLVEDCVVVRPGVGVDVENEGFWSDLTGVEPTVSAKRFHVYAARIYTQGGDSPTDEDSYWMCLLFFLGGEYCVDSSAHRAMWLLAELAHRVHSIEMQAHAHSIERLCGIRLFPDDVRPHTAYYPNTGRVCTPRLETAVSHFLKAIARRKEFRKHFATADIWSYDWSTGRFSCLSTYFRYMDRRAGVTIRVHVGGRSVSLQEAYADAFASLTPRPIGKTSFILSSHRALIVEDPKASGATSCPEHPELDLGTFIGVPLALLDQDNGRRIHSVLYVRCRHVIRHAHRLVPAIIEVARASRGIECYLAPAMTQRGSTGSCEEVLPVSQEPDRVHMVSVGSTEVAME